MRERKRERQIDRKTETARERGSTCMHLLRDKQTKRAEKVKKASNSDAKN